MPERENEFLVSRLWREFGQSAPIAQACVLIAFWVLSIAILWGS